MNNKNASSSTINKTPYFNFDSSDLGDLVKTRAFVDKTIMIKEISRATSKMIIITAPHRFGKSSNLDMLKKFFEIQVDQNGLIINKDVSSNYHIFKDNNLLIFRDTYFFERHFATDPTIHVDFNLITGDSFDEVLDKFRFVLHETFKQHGYLVKSDKLIESEKMHFQQFSDEKSYRNLNEKDIEKGLTFLLECVYKHFNGKNVLVFIDGYDAPITNTMFKDNIEIEQVSKVFSVTYLNDNKYVKRVFLTGIYEFRFLYISRGCDYKEYLFLTNHYLVPYYGLTEHGVTKLLTDFNIDSKTKEKIKLHYKGYLIATGIEIYSIWSILKFLEQKEIQNYWEDSGMVVNLMNVLVESSSIEALYLGKSVSINRNPIDLYNLNQLKRKYLQNEDFKIYTSDIYLNFLLQEGYLAVEKDTQRVKIPNAEIFNPFQKKILDHYGESINASVANCSGSFNKISSSQEDKIFVDFITDFNELLNKLKNRYNRDAYHCNMFFILLKSKFSLITKYNDNTTCVDLIARYSDLLIFINVTYDRWSEYALDQIETEYLKMYDGKSLLKNGTTSVCIGLNVSQNNIADISVLVRKARHFGI